jgi:hypothetical protein
MATYTADHSYHATLVAATVDTVTLTGSSGDYVQVVNRGATGDIYFTVDGTTPVTAAADTYVVVPNTALTVYSGDNQDKIKLISAGTPSYSVQGAYDI